MMMYETLTRKDTAMVKHVHFGGKALVTYTK